MRQKSKELLYIQTGHLRRQDWTLTALNVDSTLASNKERGVSPCMDLDPYIRVFVSPCGHSLTIDLL